MAETAAPPKPVHTLVLDAGPLLKNVPPLSSLLAQAEELVTTPSVINEIRDPDARSRIETMYMPFLKQRTPTAKSISVLSEFARKTGDRPVLSKVDIEVLALAYEIECERNGGDWRLRSVPGQKGLNGKPPGKEEEKKQQEGEEKKEESEPADTQEKAEDGNTNGTQVDEVAKDLEKTTLDENPKPSEDHSENAPADDTPSAEQTDESAPAPAQEAEAEAEAEVEEDEPEDSDSEGWITPSNIKKRQAQDEGISASATPEPKVMQVATMTTDFARIRHLKTYIKRCHACFCTTKEMNRQFCPRCGKDTLTRVSCTTDANGQFKLHLKKNMQWNNRGNRYSIPKPVPGNASGKWKGGGGGKGGWGTELILAEDQKEYIRAVKDQQRQLRNEHDLMDEDYLPSILSGERHKIPGGRIKVGAGRNVNAKKRR
ncbi:Proteasome maturation ans ribosome synthesis protein Nop10 [Rasamsonia emersonii CBS 393.64]|uniref:20S-pre-rRNA D-site endonuclease NOB1 n=1 Tax=Rasamsonia emersonii (strain ATCC 16479 / CBS 393.64 / IMI 116815) TaxID=1408163 RepID=A0A0F4YS83_RASE3|nr:Proteasome maturation ans ribosome synthesis protein Nop10 [Rasamsonia emersonii CBS 393.64]KKA20691.1 Proteasome maturation ans ribosome synthesis protein Nop10 [Rasamsonia emersonii CBS 393.64]